MTQDAKDEARESSGVQAAPRVARARVKKEKDPEWERTEGDEEDEEEEREPVRKSLRLAGGKVSQGTFLWILNLSGSVSANPGVQVPEIKRFTYEQFEFLDKELKSRRIKPEDFYLVNIPPTQSRHKSSGTASWQPSSSSRMMSWCRGTPLWRRGRRCWRRWLQSESQVLLVIVFPFFLHFSPPPRARTFSGKTERPDGLKPVVEDRCTIHHP